MSRVLAEEGVEVYAEGDEADRVLEEAKRLSPDAVVLGRDSGDGRELGARVRIVAPNAKVILWARDETEMEVFDPGSSTPRRIRMGATEALLTEVVGSERVQ